MLPRKPKAVVFDMDGLLFDTECIYRDATIDAASAMGHDVPEDFFLALIGLPNDESVQIILDRLGPDVDVPLLWQEAKRRFYQQVEAGPPLKPGVLEILEALDTAGLPRAIATSSARSAVDHHLAAHGLDQRFPVIVAYGDYERGKPNPDPFLTAATRLGIAPADCLALEDSHNGVRAASSAGMMTVMIPDLLSATDEMRDLCVGIATDLHMVRGWL